MPYIKRCQRDAYFHTVENLIDRFAAGVTPGELNYLFTKLARGYVSAKGLNYTHLNDVIGAFESAKAEFQRRVVNPYEDQCILKNGDLE